ncbi:DUF4097 family beta strand repeat-containing protein [Kribbella sp. NPDC055071]
MIKLPRLQSGLIDAKVVPGCERATMSIYTANETQRSGDMVRDVLLSTDGNTMTADFVDDGQNVFNDSPIEVRIELPPGSTLDCTTDVAEVRADGLASVSAQTRSGSVVLERCTSADVRTEGGPVTLGDIEGADVRTKGAEGSVSARRIGIRATIRTRGGAIRVADLGAPISRFSTDSGEIHVHATGPGHINLSSNTGAITVTVTDDDLASQLRINVDGLTGSVDVPHDSIVMRGLQLSYDDAPPARADQGEAATNTRKGRPDPGLNL